MSVEEGWRIASSILGGWCERLRGRLRPRACPYSLAGALDMPGRRLVAGPRRLLDVFSVGPALTVLEIGPGTGFYTPELTRRVGPSGHVICLDLQLEMLHHTRSRLGACGHRAAYVRADACALPLASEVVDQVLLITVLGEIPDRASALAEMSRVLRPGGRLCVAEQFPDPDFVPMRTLRRELAAAGFVEGKTRGSLFYTSAWSKAPADAAHTVAQDNKRVASTSRPAPIAYREFLVAVKERENRWLC